MVQDRRFPDMAGNAECIRKIRSHPRGRGRGGGAGQFTPLRSCGVGFPKASAETPTAAHFAGTAARSLRSASAGEMRPIGGRAALTAALLPRSLHRAACGAGVCLSPAGPMVPPVKRAPGPGLNNYRYVVTLLP